MVSRILPFVTTCRIPRATPTTMALSTPPCRPSTSVDAVLLALQRLMMPTATDTIRNTAATWLIYHP